MIRYLAARLRRTFRPLNPGSIETPMERNDIQDPIATELREAVREHIEAGEIEQETHARRVQATIDDLLARIGPRH